MSAIAGHLFRRGMEIRSAVKEGEKVEIHISGWAMMLLGVTALAFFGLMFMIDYTFGTLIPALLMVESPPDNIDFQPLSTEDDDGTIKDPEQRGTAGSSQYITSSFRRTVRLLSSKAGFRSCFRGLSIHIVNSILASWLAMIIAGSPISAMSGVTFGTGVVVVAVNVISAVVLAGLPLTWTHIVISEPSPKSWFRRIPSFKLWKKVAAPTAIRALCQQISVIIPLSFATVTGVHRNPGDIVNQNPHDASMNAAKSIVVILLSLGLSVLLVLPATVTLTRIQASLLSDAEETIIPFDRTFGGKVVPEIIGGSGMIGMLDAWKSFDWASRLRLIKVYAKFIGMQVAVTVLFTLVFVAEVMIIGVQNFKDVPIGRGRPAHGM